MVKPPSILASNLLFSLRSHHRVTEPVRDERRPAHTRDTYPGWNTPLLTTREHESERPVVSRGAGENRHVRNVPGSPALVPHHTKPHSRGQEPFTIGIHGVDSFSSGRPKNF